MCLPSLFPKTLCTVLVELTSISLGFNSEWHFTLVIQGSPFLQPWCLGVAVTTRGLKGCRVNWEMGHIICPWNIMWHNMTPRHLYVKVNILAWQLNKSWQGSCQCGFIPAAEKEVLWHRVAIECVGGTLYVCRASVHKFNPHGHKSVGSGWKGIVSFVLLLKTFPAESTDRCWSQS